MKFAAGLLIALLALLIAPEPRHVHAAQSGDQALAERVRAIIGGDAGGFDRLSVAVINRGQISTALIGDQRSGPLFEIGSVTKTMTGMLLADLVADGVVTAQDTLGETLPGVDLPAATASITLEELASQRSGLPRLAPDRLALVQSSLATISGRNPYGEDVEALLDSAGGAEPGDSRGKVGYSNFGMALLGQALAAKTGIPYPELVTQRILEPLGMTATLPIVPEPAPDGLATGQTASGNTTEPWSGDGYAPAGIGPRSTADDLGRFVAATMAGTAPGADAATPRFAGDDPGERIGYAWFTDRYGDRDVTWHNGGTGGFRSYVGFDRATKQGVVVLGNTDRAVEWIGLRLLGATPPDGTQSANPGLARVAATVVLLGWAALALPILAFVPPRRGVFARPDRLRLAASTLSTIAVLLLAHRIGTWLVLPTSLWALAAGAAGVGLTALLLRSRVLPIVADGRPAVRLTATVVSAAISVAAIWWLS